MVSRDQLGRIPWDIAQERRGEQESQIFRDHFLQAQESIILTSRKLCKDSLWTAWMSKELLTELKT